jgi:hypothetical protein
MITAGGNRYIHYQVTKLHRQTPLAGGTAAGAAGTPLAASPNDHPDTLP